MSEIPEVTSAMLDSKMVAILNKYPELVDSIHFSDQVRCFKININVFLETFPLNHHLEFFESIFVIKKVFPAQIETPSKKHFLKTF
jgi:hypothetical protein